MGVMGKERVGGNQADAVGTGHRALGTGHWALGTGVKGKWEATGA